MAESPSSSHTPPPPPPPPPPTPPSVPNDPDPTQYWCYQCDKRVPIETLPDQPDIICFECKNGFVELISVNHPQAVEVPNDDQPAFGNEFLQVLRLIAQAARDDDAPPPPPDRDGHDNDYLRIELDGWDENDGDDDDEDEDDDDDENEDGADDNHTDRIRDGSDDHDENEDEQVIVEEEDEDIRRRQRRDVIRLRLRDFATRALARRHRVLDWAEILMGLEDNSIEFRFQVPGDSDGYIGNPGDYVDAAGYEALLQNLAESDAGKRGAPPAAKSAVEALPSVEVKSTDTEVCAICKDKLFNNDKEIAKQLPCGHMYHEDCIVPWLGSRNSCPVCRYELPTDDPEYEEDRKKRSTAMATTTSTASDGEV